MELLRELAHQDGNGAVIVSHDLRLRAIADRVLWMEDGRLDGAPAAAFTPGEMHRT